jgi:hypothetical protein
MNKLSFIELTIQDLPKLLAGLAIERTPTQYDDIRRWSYGDVENNGVYYHPQLTNYAHQAFEQFFSKNGACNMPTFPEGTLGMKKQD